MLAETRPGRKRPARVPVGSVAPRRQACAQGAVPVSVPALVMTVPLEGRLHVELVGLDGGGSVARRLADFVLADPELSAVVRAALVLDLQRPRPSRPGRDVADAGGHAGVVDLAEGCRHCATVYSHLAALDWAPAVPGAPCCAWRPGAASALCGRPAPGGTAPIVHALSTCEAGHFNCRRCTAAVWGIAHAEASS